MSLDRIARGVSQADLVSALQDADPRGKDGFELLYEIPAGEEFDPVLAISEQRAALDQDPIPSGEIDWSAHHVDIRRGGSVRASEDRARRIIKQRAERTARQYRIDTELAWLNDNDLFRGRAPAPGEEFGAYTDRIRGQSDRERQSDARRRKRIERSGNYAVDMDLSGFTAEQFDFIA